MPVTPANLHKYVHSAVSHKPWYLIFAITIRCNQLCSMCYNRAMDAEEDSDTLTIEEIEKVAAGFDNLFQLTLSGGEPTIRKDLPEIIRAFNRKRAVPRITIPSNGQLPDHIEKVITRIAKENPDSNINLALSLDGIGEVHDKVRGVPKAYQRHLETKERIRRLREKYPNITLVIASVMSKYNHEHIPELLQHIARDAEPQAYGLMIARGVAKERDATEVDQENFLQALQQLRDIQRNHHTRVGRAWTEAYQANREETIRTGRMKDPCTAGSKLMILNHNGFLWPCEMLEHPEEMGFPPLEGGFCFGNVKDVDYDVNKLMNSPQADRIRDYIQKGRCNCTFECALLCNFALNPKNYFKTLGNLITHV